MEEHGTANVLESAFYLATLGIDTAERADENAAVIERWVATCFPEP